MIIKRCLKPKTNSNIISLQKQLSKHVIKDVICPHTSSNQDHVLYLL